MLSTVKRNVELFLLHAVSSKLKPIGFLTTRWRNEGDGFYAEQKYEMNSGRRFRVKVIVHEMTPKR